MKNLLQWMMAAILVCGASVFTSCSDDKDSDIDNLSEKIIGKWITADIDGQAALTNEKMVVTFVSPTKATVSESRSDYGGPSVKWSAAREYDVLIDDNKVTLTGHPTNINTIINELTITSISVDKMICTNKHTVIRNDQVIKVTETQLCFTKLTADYSGAVLGLWECTELTGIETYNDANARLEFYANGTYKYWRKNTADQWEAVTTRDFQEYFADGTLLATRWKNQGEAELREWWEIESLSASEMVWKALRGNADGSTSVQTMKWKRVLL